MFPVIDVYVDRSGDAKFYSDQSMLQRPVTKFICFDVRNILQLGAPAHHVALDVKMLYEHDGSLSSLVKSQRVACKELFLEAERRLSTHTRALSGAKVAVDDVPLSKLIPENVLNDYMNLRVTAISELFAKLDDKKIEHYEDLVWPVFLDILKIEKVRIKLDEKHIDSMLKRNDLAVHEAAFFRSAKGLLKDGFVRTKISPVGTKTARFRSEGGFHAQGIPHGVCRKSVVSRFEGGTIATLDFNAIDYRSLVSIVDDKNLNAMYGKSRDFHTVTAKLFGDEVTPELRDLTKKITYSDIYGSSHESLQKQTLLPMTKLVGMLNVLSPVFEPITTFRKKLAEQARNDGFVITPGGLKVHVNKDDHDGKIVGLYAQTHSSYMFNRAIHAALTTLEILCAQSRLIFTVHDEIVLDVHPDEKDVVQKLQVAMEEITGFVVKIKEGRTYSDATD